MRTWFFAKSIITLTLFSLLLSAYELPSGKRPSLDNDDVKHLQEISRGISEIAGHVQKGVVFVSVSKVIKGQPFGLVNPFDFFFGPQPNPYGNREAPEFKQQGLGSGFFVDLEKGYIMTNNHVIKGADEIQVKLANGESHEAKVVGRDENTDVAIVQIKGDFKKDGIVDLGLANSDEVKVGDICIALGAPFGLEASLSMGVVSAIGRGNLSITELGNFIQTDAAINPGNSGGPLVNTAGEVIGMNTAIFSKSGGYNGIGFAIPASLARTVANQLVNKGKVERGYLGVGLSEIDPDLAKELGVPKNTTGALIRSVEPGSPADKGGLEPGDVVVNVEGQKVQDMQHLRNVIGLHKPGKKVKLVVYRNGKQLDKAVTLGNFNDALVAQQGDQPGSEFGLSLSNLNDGLRRSYGIRGKTGAVVVGIEQNSAADRAGLQEGDLIVKANDANVRGAQDFWRAAKDKERLLLRVERRGQFLFMPLKRA